LDDQAGEIDMTQLCAETAAPRDASRLCQFVSPSTYEAFEGVLADIEALRNACFRVRHQVYCQERRFESAAAFPNGLETDEHDSHSLHGLLRYRRTGEPVGTVRLILPRSRDADLPLYSLVKRSGCGTAVLPPVAVTAEVSRFAISKDFRGRAGDGSHGSPVPRPDDHGAIANMALGLMAIVFKMRSMSAVEYLCAVMEPALIRLLSRFGIRWRAVGPLIEHRGWRQPCVARIDDMTNTIATERPDVWSLISGTGAAAMPGPVERRRVSIAA
jgi:N-acyl amino acid synthase of PEP-CTERM/exosortase system